MTVEELLLVDFSEPDGSLDITGVKEALQKVFVLGEEITPIFETAMDFVYGPEERTRYSKDLFVPLVLYTERLVKLHRRLRLTG